MIDFFFIDSAFKTELAAVRVKEKEADAKSYQRFKGLSTSVSLRSGLLFKIQFLRLSFQGEE